MRIILAISFIVNSGLVLADGSNFLIGTWVSDKGATINYNKSRVNWTEEQYTFLKENLGKLKIIFTESTVSINYEEDLGINKYKITERDDTSITVRSELSKEVQEFLNLDIRYKDTKYYKDGNKIYVEPEGTKILLREYFVKDE